MFSEASPGDGTISVVRYLQRSVIAATILMYALPALHSSGDCFGGDVTLTPTWQEAM